MLYSATHIWMNSLKESGCLLSYILEKLTSLLGFVESKWFRIDIHPTNSLISIIVMFPDRWCHRRTYTYFLFINSASNHFIISWDSSLKKDYVLWQYKLFSMFSSMPPEMGPRISRQNSSSLMTSILKFSHQCSTTLLLMHQI